MEQYEVENRGELDRLVSQGREVQCAVKKREFSVQCAEIYSGLMGAEEVLRWKQHQQEQSGSSSSSKEKSGGGKNKKNDDTNQLSGGGYEDTKDDDDDWSEDETDEGKSYIL